MEVPNMFQTKNGVKQGLKIIIVGCGKVGSTLIEQLSKEGHDITIIDKRADKIQNLRKNILPLDFFALDDVLNVNLGKKP